MNAALAAAALGLAALSAPWQARAVARETGTPPPGPRVTAGYAAASALIATALAVAVPAAVFPAGVLLGVGGVPLSIIDTRSHRLPNRLTGLTLLAVLVALGAAAGLIGSPGQLVAAVAGAGAMAAFYGLLLTVSAVFGSAAAYGLGDVKLALPVGAVLGWLGVLPWLAGLLGAHLLYVAVFGGRAMVGRTGWRSRHAYGPCMLAATLAAAILFG